MRVCPGIEMTNSSDVTVVIPNYNGGKYIEQCLRSVYEGSEVPHVIVVDNGSEDGSADLVAEEFPEVTLLKLSRNTGFCHAVNAGIRLTRTDYCFLLNNDTEIDRDCVRNLRAAIGRSEKIFAVQAKMVSLQDPGVLDDAGDFTCALGWSMARGKGQPADRYPKPGKIFAACAGAALYRMSVFDEIGLFDERHFAYLEDVDLCWRAQIFGYRSMYEPSAVVRHAGSASTGSRWNEFKEVMTAGNNRYLLWKNMPVLQYGFNWPLTKLGVSVKRRFFREKGLGEAYENGLARGEYLIERAKYIGEMRRFDLPETGTIEEEAGILPENAEETDRDFPENTGNGESMQVQPAVEWHPLYLGGKVPFRMRHLPHYLAIQLRLFKNLGVVVNRAANKV